MRQYARLLGLDEEAIAGQVQQVLGPAPEVPQLAGKSKPAGFAPIQVPKVDEWETVGDKRFRWSGWLSAVVLVAVMLVCSAVYAWMQRPKSPSTAQANPRPAQPRAPPSAPASVSCRASERAFRRPSARAIRPWPTWRPRRRPGATAGRRNRRNRRHRPCPSATAAAHRPIPMPPLHVEITADEAVWVLARADGKYAFSATMDAHTTRTVEGVKEVTLRLGNAGGVTISLNGKPIGPAGPKGQVRTIQFTSGGFQIVPAKPPSAPLDRL